MPSTGTNFGGALIGTLNVVRAGSHCNTVIEKRLQAFASFSAQALALTTCLEDVAVADSDSHFYQDGLLALSLPTVIVPVL